MRVEFPGSSLIPFFRVLVKRKFKQTGEISSLVNSVQLNWNRAHSAAYHISYESITPGVLVLH